MENLPEVQKEVKEVTKIFTVMTPEKQQRALGYIEGLSAQEGGNNGTDSSK